MEFTEDRVPTAGIEEVIAEMAELYGGEVKAERQNARDVILPLRRGVPTAGAVECSVTWDGDSVTVTTNREIDAPKAQRVALLAVGVIGALMFTVWPFFAHARELGTLAWVGGLVALAVYFMTLKKTSGGLAADFLRRLVGRQRAAVTTDP
ncbi:MAG: hypothetical protein AABO58_06185 [Acidobacteriota bacterium]